MKLSRLLLFMMFFALVGTGLSANGFKVGKAVDIQLNTIEALRVPVQDAVDLNATFVRLHIFNRSMMVKYGLSADTAMEYNIALAKMAYSVLKSKGIKTMVVISDHPTGLWSCTNKLDGQYWTNISCLNQIVKNSYKLMDAFKDTSLAGFQPFGEPVERVNNKWATPLTWDAIFRELIKYRDKSNKKQLLFYSIGAWNNPYLYKNMLPFEAKNIVYTANMYFPHGFTHQGIRNNKSFSYPDDTKRWNKQNIRFFVKPLVDFGDKYNVPVYITEFGTVNWAKDRDVYMKDVLEVFKELKIDWSFYNLSNSWKGWDTNYVTTKDKDNRKIFTRVDDSNKTKLIKSYLNQ